MRLWVNGRLLSDPDEPVVSSTDHGLTVGDGVFETLKLMNGRPFALTRHLDRLASSAAGLGLPEPDLDLVRQGIEAVVDSWGEPTGQLRVTYTGGPSPFGSERVETTPTLAVGIAALSEMPSATAVAVVPWKRNEHGALTGLKTTSYGENVVALAYARERGATEALFANTRGDLCEGTGSNVFVVVGGDLLTPPLTSGCLAGVTRALVLEWYGGKEIDLPMTVLDEADEIFVVSTKRDVQGVHRVDDRVLQAPGPITTEAMEIFARRAALDVDP